MNCTLHSGLREHEKLFSGNEIMESVKNTIPNLLKNIDDFIVHVSQNLLVRCLFQMSLTELQHSQNLMQTGHSDTGNTTSMKRSPDSNTATPSTTLAHNGWPENTVIPVELTKTLKQC